MISIQHLRKTYGEKVAVDDVSLDVAEGEVLGILGPNGAGKTTTVECVAGLRVPDSGTVAVAGLDPRTDREALTRVLGVQLQESRLQPRITVSEALRLWSALYDDPLPWHELVERLGLAAQAGTEVPRPERRPAAAAVDRARARRPSARGDPRRAHHRPRPAGPPRRVGDRARPAGDGVTVLLVTHSMEEAEQLCDRIAIIDGGRVTRARHPGRAHRRRGRGHRHVVHRRSARVDLEALRALASVSPRPHRRRPHRRRGPRRRRARRARRPAPPAGDAVRAAGGRRHPRPGLPPAHRKQPAEEMHA